MRILIVTSSTNSVGGVESMTRLLQQVLTDEGHHVDVIGMDSLDSGLNQMPDVRLLGVSIKFASHVRRICPKYDLLICNGEFSFGVSHPRCINIFHGTYYGYSKFLGKNHSLLQKLHLWMLANVQASGARGKHVMAVSRFVRDLLAEQGITVHSVIPNGIDTKKFRPQRSVKRTKRFLFVGTYNYYGKGFDVLQKVAGKGFNIDCVTNKDPGKGLRWMKNVSYEEMPQLYNQYSLLVFPSRFEGAPLAPLEAMACGLPVIMNNVGIGWELKAEIPEFVVENNSADIVEEYSTRIEGILSNHRKYSRLAREFTLKGFSLEVYRKKWREIIDSLTST